MDVERTKFYSLDDYLHHQELLDPETFGYSTKGIVSMKHTK